MKKYTKKEITEFLMESNAIEGVYGAESLKQAEYAWANLAKATKLTKGVILRTHKILMLKQPLLPDYKGYFRKCRVWIGGREGLKWELIPEEIEVWLKEMNRLPVMKNNLEEISQKLHVGYEEIHPFADGNGRTGRMFMNWWRMRNNLPILIIHEGDEQMAYYQWFK